ncbi:MAG: universal stress protein [SAR324 cluster bacterium]|nr:universal stress protein [SAR324 cluster bacterium]
MFQLKRILVPADGSETSKRALQYAIELARSFNASMTLLMVVDDQHLDFLGPASYPENLNEIIEKRMMDQAKATLKEFLPSSSDSSISTETVILRGYPVTEIIEYAKTHEIDMIVMGTHGRTGVTHVVIGSIAEKVVRMAPCPVLTVKPIGH